jgi:hypothetical protein
VSENEFGGCHENLNGFSSLERQLRVLRGGYLIHCSPHLARVGEVSSRLKIVARIFKVHHPHERRYATQFPARG